MELYAAVRRSVYVEGWSERAAARRFGLARETVRKMLRYRLPPGYRRQKPIRCPKLEAFTGVIDQILRDDQHRPKKQRHTAKRICERLRAEHDFTGGYTIVKAYVREQKLGGQEMFVPLAHPPGDAQADFGEALVVIDGVERKAHYLVVDLPHSDDAFVKAFPAETTEAFCDGHNAAFHYFGGVPRRIVYDNTKLAVARAPVPYDACDQRSTRVTSLSLVRYRRNDYSVPTAYGHRAVVVKGYVDEVVIVCGSEEIARHRRSYDREVLIFDPRHYLALLERKTGALDQAAPLVGWALPEEFLRLRRLLEARLGKPGTREYVQVLRLLEDFRLAHVRGAVRDALTLSVIGFDAVKHLTLCRIEHRPPQLDLAQYPLPAARVATTAAADYLALLGAGTE